MKLTFITGYFDPEQTADVHLNHDLAYGLSDLGVEVTVVTPFPNRGLSEKDQFDYLDRKTETISDNLRLVRVGKPSSYKQGILRRGLFLLKRTVQLYKKAKDIQTDVYLITSTPPFLGYLAAILSKKAPVVYKLQDVFPDSLAFTKRISKDSAIYRRLQKMEKWVYSRCSAIVADSEDIKETIVHGRADVQKVSVIYDWIDECSCVPINKDDNPLFDEYNIPRGPFCVCYAGNIGPLQNTELIVDVAREMEKHRKNADVIFVILGSGSHEKMLDEYIEKCKCSNIFRVPMQPLEKVSYVYSLGDADLVTLVPGMTKIALPSKIWSAMSAGRPSICSFDKDSTLRTIIETNGCGICAEAGDSSGLIRAVLDLYENMTEREQMGRNAREYIEKNMTKQIAISKYHTLIKKLVSWNNS